MYSDRDFKLILVVPECIGGTKWSFRTKHVNPLCIRLWEKHDVEHKSRATQFGHVRAISIKYILSRPFGKVPGVARCCRGEVAMEREMNAPKTGILASMVALARIPESQIPRTAHRMARLSLFDWMVVGWAGRNEPLGHIIRDYVRNEGGHETASLIGGGKVPVRGAALANGTVSHALDYDDTHFAHMGHPSVAILPAALSAAEEVDVPSKAVVDAFLLGAEASVRIGMVLGRDHYLKGFHQTATSGAFGATIAAGRIYGLDEGRMRHALALCATKASGLKSQFGTMGKPLNAGLAAANGVECAGLAARGLISCDDGIEGPQGFLDTHSISADREAFRNDGRAGTFLFGNVSHKFHACCHGAHAMIEALLSLRKRETIGPGMSRASRYA